MNSKQKCALGMGAVAAMALGLLYPWTNQPYALSLPDNALLLRWGIMDIRIGGNILTSAWAVVAALTGLAVFSLRNKTAPKEFSDNTPPIPDP